MVNVAAPLAVVGPIVTAAEAVKMSDAGLNVADPEQTAAPTTTATAPVYVGLTKVAEPEQVAAPIDTAADAVNVPGPLEIAKISFRLFAILGYLRKTP